MHARLSRLLREISNGQSVDATYVRALAEDDREYERLYEREEETRLATVHNALAMVMDLLASKLH